MRLAIITAATAAALAASPAALAATGPTQKQIQAAVKQAERSKDLWATVNICNTHSHPNSVGIRGQMPGLGFRAQLTMDFKIHYWSVSQKRFKLVNGAERVVSLGSATTGLHQDGVTFRFAPHAGFLASTIRFDWTLGHTSIAHLTRWTSNGHPDADGGDPAHYSAGKCLLK